MRGVKYTTVFEDLELQIMFTLGGTVAQMLRKRRDSAPQDPLAEITGIYTGHTEPPEDPGLARLLPDFELAEHQEFAGEQQLMRSMNETDIINDKLENLAILLGFCEVENFVWTVDEREALAIVAALNDIRLFLATANVADASDMFSKADMIEWLAYNQQSLLQAVTGYED